MAPPVPYNDPHPGRLIGAYHGRVAEHARIPSPYHFRMGTNELALKMARRLFPRLVWSGAGVIVRKNYFERVALGGWMPMMPAHLQQGWVSGTVPPRWVLVVKDIADKEHVVAVAAEIWQSYDVGDLVTADDPLVDID